jgi:hypothetical protein
MASTYEPIAKTILTGSASSITLSSIPSTYTDLILIIRGVAGGSVEADKLWLNNDTSALYSNTRLINGNSAGTGGSPVSYRSSNANNISLQSVVGFSGGDYGGYFIYQFQNYANTTTFKTFLARTNLQRSDGGSEVGAAVCLYRSTSAINQITFAGILANLAAGTSLELYGIKAA